MLHGVAKSEPRRAKNDPQRAQNGPKRSQRRPKTTPRGTQEVQKSDPEPQDAKRTEPRRSQDRLRPPSVRLAQLSRPPGAPFGSPKRHQNRPPNDQRSKSENSRRKKNDPSRFWTRLGAILGRFGAPSWAKKRLKQFVLNGFVKIIVFEDKTVRRRFWDQLGPKKAPT